MLGILQMPSQQGSALGSCLRETGHQSAEYITCFFIWHTEELDLCGPRRDPSIPDHTPQLYIGCQADICLKNYHVPLEMFPWFLPSFWLYLSLLSSFGVVPLALSKDSLSESSCSPRPQVLQLQVISKANNPNNSQHLEIHSLLFH